MVKSQNNVEPEENAEAGRWLPRGWQLAAILGSLVLLGMIGGYFISRSLGHRVNKGVVLAGLPIGGFKASEARAVLEARCATLGRTPVTLVLESRSFVVTPDSTGLSVDYDNSVRKALSVGRTGGILTRLRERKKAAEKGLVLEPTIKLQADKWEEFCRGLEAEVNSEPVEAHIEVDRSGKITVIPGRDGRTLDRAALAGLLRKAFYQDKDRRYELRAIKTYPKLSNKGIAEWPLDQVLGFYTSKFSPADDQRSHNLKMAAEALDCVIVAPGEEFSFNKNVGPRVPEKGYMEAPVVSRNRLVLGVGGGVCQVSGTLFNAVLLAGLPITKRTTHSIPSTYVPLGRDATVVYDAVDLAFVNDTGRPLLITGQIGGPYLTIAVVGHRDQKPQVDLAVEIKERIPFEIVTENDPGLAAGVEAVTQQGRDGYKVQLWRTIAWPGKTKIREPIGGVVFYPPSKQVIKRGIGSPRFGAMPPVKPPQAAEQRPPADDPGVPAPTPAPQPGGGSP